MPFSPFVERRNANCDRYLIANAMQAFTAQPLTKQTQSNPFADRALLAALIIPHLETYLATHPDVRFLLIEYPSEHLPTVIALQTLIGTDMMKVVGIINSDASAPSQSLSVPETDRRPSEGFRSLNRRGSRLSGAFVGPCSFSKTNFLLASSATGFETAAFIAAIRESLISISDFYIPERPLYKPTSAAAHFLPRKPQPALAINTSLQQQKGSLTTLTTQTIITPPSSPSSPFRAQHPNSKTTTTSSSPPPPPARTSRPAAYTSQTTATSTTGARIRWGEVNYAPSVTTTTSSSTSCSSKSTADTTSGAHHRPHHPIHHHRHQDSDPLSPGALPQPQPPAVTRKGAIMDGGDEDDDDDDDDEVMDAEERRLMPLYWRRREEVDRGGSSKALRWLGLV